MPSFLLSFRNSIRKLRLELMFIGASCALAGMSYGPDQTRFLFVLAFAAFFSSYAFGRIFILELREKKEEKVLWFSGLGLLSCICIFSFLSLGNLFLSVLALVAFGIHTLWGKNRWYCAPVFIGFTMVVLSALGFLSMGGEVGELLKPQMLWLYLFTFTSFINFLLITKIESFKKDLASNKATLISFLGEKRALFLGDIFAFLSTVVAGMLVNYTDKASLLIFLIGTLIAFLGQWKASLALKRRSLFSFFVVCSPLRSFILWHLAVFVGERGEYLVFTLFIYFVFELFLHLRRAHYVQT